MAGFVLLEGSNTLNLSAPSGTSFPQSGATNGDYLYRTDLSALYLFNGTAWEIIVSSEPETDALSELRDVNLTPLTVGQSLSWNGTKWVNSVPFPVYDVAGSIIGKPLNGGVTSRFVAVRPYNLAANLTGSKAKCVIAPTAAQTLTINKNDSEIGTINFAIGATNGTFVFPFLVSFTPGDVLTVVNQATADTTFADIEYTLVANLT